MLGLAASAHAFADDLTVYTLSSQFACAAPTSVSSGGTSASCSGPAPAGTISSTAKGDLATGVFGATAVSNVAGLGGGIGTAFFAVTYDFTVSGVINGTAQFDISTNGRLAIPQNPDDQGASTAFSFL
jgi:hypothetical protein